jgi:hypothetical protein
MNARISVEGVSVSVSGASSDDIAGVAVHLLSRFARPPVDTGSIYCISQKQAMAISREVAVRMKVAADAARQQGTDMVSALAVALQEKREQLRGKGYADDVIDAAFARARLDAKWRELLVSHPSRKNPA